MTAAFIDLERVLLRPDGTLRATGRDLIAFHRLQGRLVILLTVAARSRAEQFVRDLKTDGVIIADGQMAADPRWRDRSIAEFCRRYGLEEHVTFT